MNKLLRRVAAPAILVLAGTATLGILAVAPAGATAAAPTVTKLAPAGGDQAGGTKVTITGTNLTGVKAVHFGTAVAKVDKSVSSTELEVTAPPAKAAGAVNVTVTTAAGTSKVTTADAYTYAAAPTVTKLSPATGPAAGGTTVTITGTGFVNGAVVHFGTAAAKVDKYVSSTELEVTSPKGSGTVNVTVITAYGGSSKVTTADRYTYSS